jgi:hypothetical protein
MRASAVRSGPLERDVWGLVDDVDDHQKKRGGGGGGSVPCKNLEGLAEWSETGRKEYSMRYAKLVFSFYASILL